MLKDILSEGAGTESRVNVVMVKPYLTSLILKGGHESEPLMFVTEGQMLVP